MADDYTMAVRHAERNVPGARYVTENPRNGPAELLEYVVDRYVQMSKQCERLRFEAVPVFVSISAKGESDAS